MIRDKLADFSWWFVKQWRFALAVMILMFGAGIFLYTSFLPREGFPSVQFPLTIVNVTKVGASADDIDKQIARPATNKLNELDIVEEVRASTEDNFSNITVSFKQDTDPVAATNKTENTISKLKNADDYQIEYTSINPSKYLNKYDALISVYAKDNQPVTDQEKAADYVSKQLETIDSVKLAEVKKLTTKATNPFTGEEVNQKIFFNQVGVRKKEKSDIVFYPAITVGVVGDSDSDIIELRDVIQEKLDKLEQTKSEKNEKLEDYGLVIGASFAENIEDQISSLEENLLTGVVAVAVVTLLLIGLRASVVTAIFMVSVVLATMIGFYVVGYSLNTITLFALVLTLGLFVDDATIMVEAIDAERENSKNKKKIIREAAKKVALASFAGTMTTALVFAPLTFISGVLGEFIRVMPVTVVISLILSYVLSLILVPVLARFTILAGKNNKRFPLSLSPLEQKLGKLLSGSVMWLKTKPKQGKIWASLMILISVGFVVTAGILATDLKFNIFPQSEDAVELRVSIDYNDGTNLPKAENLAGKINQKIIDEIGENTEQIIYGGFTLPSERGADLVVKLTPVDERAGKNESPELAESLQPKLNKLAGKSAEITVEQIDAGPPANDYPFMVQIYQSDFDKSKNLAKEIQDYLDEREIVKSNGEKAHIIDTKVDYASNITRIDGERVIQVVASYDDSDVSSLVTKTQDSLEKEFSADKLDEEGYERDALEYDFGQESENAESFSALGTVFPIALGLMFVLLALQFRSLIQPLLILLAIPFSALGVVLSLLITDNALSFFSMVGVVGLIGIAVNNSIMLTDYANQARKEGKSLVDALATASRERFRPLLTTTITTAVALLPLALYDPFWQPLAVVIIGGLISSTLLVILAFPYYYYLVARLGHLIKSKLLKRS